MELYEIERRYERLGAAEMSYEVGDLTKDELRRLKSDMRGAGWAFDRTEIRYADCRVAVFYRIQS